MWKQSTGTRYGRGTRWSPGTRISLLYPGTVGDKAAWQGSMIGGGVKGKRDAHPRVELRPSVKSESRQSLYYAV